MSEILISRYHPGVESPETLEEIFVGKDREVLISELLKELKNEIEDKNRYLQSHLIYGPTGIGKTFILWVLFNRIKEDENLKRYYLPILLPEELFGVNNVAGILLEALKIILNDSSRTIPDEDIRDFIREKLNWVIEIDDKDTRFDRCESLFDEIRNRFDKRVIIMAENLDKLLISFKRHKELDKFLKVLPRSKSIKFIGTAITFLDVLGDIKGPIYGYTYHHKLEPLNEDEVFELISRLIELYSKENEVLIKYFHSPDGRRRINIFKAISYLCGGLPRMIFPLFEIALSECSRLSDGKEAVHRFDTSLKFMQEMFERLTLIYRENLWSLPEKERMVIEILASSDKAIRPIDIKGKTGFNSAEISTYLTRLIKRGCIRTSTEVDKKKQFYILSEPLLSIWYRWRQGASYEQKWSFVVELLSWLFKKEEIKKVIEKEETPDIMKSLYTAAYERLKSKMAEAEYLREIRKEGLKSFDEALKTKPDDATVWYNKGVALRKLGRTQDAIICFDKALEI
ncbi:TPA: hypothetical protein DCX16_00635, partial [bacterium]|nr:hypothetical protein [bacterium]